MVKHICERDETGGRERPSKAPGHDSLIGPEEVISQSRKAFELEKVLVLDENDFELVPEFFHFSIQSVEVLNDFLAPNLVNFFQGPVQHCALFPNRLDVVIEEAIFALQFLVEQVERQKVELVVAIIIVGEKQRVFVDDFLQF